WVVVAGWGIAVVLVTVFMPREVGTILLGWYGVRPFGFLLKVLFTFEVCRFFTDARRNGSIEMLLCTPLTRRDILRGQWLAFRRKFLWPVFCFLVLLFIPIGVQAMAVIRALDFSGAVPVFLGSLSAGFCVVRTIADFFALYWFGMWLALTMKKPNLAPALTIVLV